MYTLHYILQLRLNRLVTVTKQRVPLNYNLFGNQNPPNPKEEKINLSIKQFTLQNFFLNV